MQAEFRPPRRRCRVYEEYVAPLPVRSRSSPEKGSASRPTRSYFRADIVNGHVLVTDPDHISDIYNQGYFGKGILSRARPEYTIFNQWRDHQGFLLPVVTCTRYEELLGWAESALLAQGSARESVDETLLRLRQPVGEDELGRLSENGNGAENLNPDPETERNKAFFLVYALGCLSVHLEQEPLSITHLWRHFISLRPDFVSSYAAYHHFRSRGWVPKGGSGAKYGVDMVLYRKGPPFYHSSYSVVVEKADERFEGSTLRPFSWRSLATLSRITATVSKELLLCYVVHPVDLTEAELASPECLSRLKIQEVVVSRWVSSKERAEHEDI
ncbi:tRNA-splicing endonuclease subunit Sen2 isoform X2 [Corythoichthys intestinalis]|uniref:tRNA-splicing endonuclease subunit Sen2 isoform X2 n=1 Tax=Corythoichthys intestinalis TaxID=161448 RepID=UPI0025A60561|nr:tRNA-splicing endonuclease subunit Sen2 isoform X2 [Corythoichthys intestinalis]